MLTKLKCCPFLLPLRGGKRMGNILTYGYLKESWESVIAWYTSTLNLSPKSP